MEYFTSRVYKIQIKEDFKKSANMLSLEQKEYVDSIYIGSTKNSLKKRFKHHKQITKNSCTTLLFAELFGSKNMEIIIKKIKISLNVSYAIYIFMRMLLAKNIIKLKTID